MPELPPHDWHAPIIAAVVAAYARSEPTTYVEIGVDRGHTMRVVAPHAVQAHAVDITFEHAGELPDNVARWECSSNEFFFTYRQSAFEAALQRPHVVFVDGDHSGLQVQSDVLNALGILAPGGTIILHDTLPIRQEWADSHCGDGWAVVEQMRQLADEPLQVFTVPLFPGLTFLSRRPEATPSG